MMIAKELGIEEAKEAKEAKEGREGNGRRKGGREEGRVDRQTDGNINLHHEK